MHKIEKRLIEVRSRIAKATQNCHRPSDSVHLLAVSKTKPAEFIRAAYAAGQTQFGENYLQEALEKQLELSELPLEWHFIGPIQSNKTKAIAENFDWVHSVDRLKVAQRLNEQRPPEKGPLNVCLQINLDNETSKSGISLAEVPDLLASCRNLPSIRVRGFMTIPARRTQHEDQQAALEPMRQLLQQSSLGHPELDTLSMGMSNDLEAAIAAGSTLVRIGTDIFGSRQPNSHQ